MLEKGTAYRLSTLDQIGGILISLAVTKAATRAAAGAPRGMHRLLRAQLPLSARRAAQLARPSLPPRRVDAPVPHILDGAPALALRRALRTPHPGPARLPARRQAGWGRRIHSGGQYDSYGAYRPTRPARMPAEEGASNTQRSFRAYSRDEVRALLDRALQRSGCARARARGA